MKNFLLTLGISLLVFGCSTTATTIIPNEDGTYTIEATDSTEANALKGGIEAASKACKEQGKSLAVISHSTRYTGGKIDHDTKELLNSAFSALNHASNSTRRDKPSSYDDTTFDETAISTRNDYTVTVKYQCKI